jgi:hypothetical protein
MSQVGTWTVTVGDTLEPANIVLSNGNDDPYDLASYTVSVVIEEEDGDSELAETTTGVTKHPTQTFTAEADDDYLTCNGHGLKTHDQVVVANSGGALPTGLAASTRYFVRDVSKNKFRLATIPDGGSIDLTTDGTGTNTFYQVGSVQFDPASANVDTAGRYRFWFVLSSGGEKKHVPEGDRYFRLNVVAIGN